MCKLVEPAAEQCLRSLMLSNLRFQSPFKLYIGSTNTRILLSTIEIVVTSHRIKIQVTKKEIKNAFYSIDKPVASINKNVFIFPYY